MIGEIIVAALAGFVVGCGVWDLWRWWRETAMICIAKLLNEGKT